MRSRYRTLPHFVTGIIGRAVIALLAVSATVTPNASAKTADCFVQDTASRWLEVAATEGNASAWFRLSFSISASDVSEYFPIVRLLVSSDATASVYANGQRILRHQEFEVRDGARLSRGFDVSRLIRPGRNSIAIELRGSQPRVLAAISMTQRVADGAFSEVSGEWKSTVTAPPVGWQQTDFNDRDWTKSAPGVKPPEHGFTPSAPAEWESAIAKPPLARNPFQFADRDHVVLLGSTFFEREQQFGHVEAILSAAAGERKVTFRNLGWDGDTVFAESRGIFDAPETGYLRMIEHVRAEEPTVIVVGFGQNDALTAGRDAVAFQQQLRRLLSDLETTGAAIVLLSPHALLPAARPVPSPTRFNPRIDEYSRAIQRIANERSLPFSNLFQDFGVQLAKADRLIFQSRSTGEIPADPDDHPDLWPMACTRWTTNGLHFNDRGYAATSLVVRERLLGQSITLPKINVLAASKQITGQQAEVRNAEWNPTRGTIVTFEVRESVLSPLPVMIALSNSSAAAGFVETSDEKRDLTVAMPPGDSAEIRSLLVPVTPQYQKLVSAIIRKNELYFHRWRPQNITYLYGFRKHEQGNNAVEIALFDPLVAELEQQIHVLQQPLWRKVTLTDGFPD